MMDLPGSKVVYGIVLVISTFFWAVVFGGGGSGFWLSVALNFGLYILITILFNVWLKNKRNEIDAQSEDFSKNTRMISKMNPQLEHEYYRHYEIDTNKIDSYDWVPQNLRAYMVKENEIWNSLGAPYVYNGRRITLAASVYSRAYAQKKMIEDETCWPREVCENFDVFDKFDDRIWKQWRSCGYDAYATEYNETGKFHAPWMPAMQNMPDWYYDEHPETKPS